MCLECTCTTIMEENETMNLKIKVQDMGGLGGERGNI